MTIWPTNGGKRNIFFFFSRNFSLRKKVKLNNIKVVNENISQKLRCRHIELIDRFLISSWSPNNLLLNQKLMNTKRTFKKDDCQNWRKKLNCIMKWRITPNSNFHLNKIWREKKFSQIVKSVGKYKRWRANGKGGQNVGGKKKTSRTEGSRTREKGKGKLPIISAGFKIKRSDCKGWINSSNAQTTARSCEAAF